MAVFESKVGILKRRLSFRTVCGDSGRCPKNSQGIDSLPLILGATVFHGFIDNAPHLRPYRFTGDFITDQTFYRILFGSLSPEPMDDITVRAGVQLHVKADGMRLYRILPVPCFWILWNPASLSMYSSPSVWYILIGYILKLQIGIYLL